MTNTIHMEFTGTPAQLAAFAEALRHGADHLELRAVRATDPDVKHALGVTTDQVYALAHQADMARQSLTSV